MKIPFSIEHREKIESGEYKVFAHEHEEQEARIVCWDNNGEYPIVALVDNEPEKFDKYGRVPGGNRGGEFSLFIVTPEPELSEFEKGCIRLYQDGRDDGFAGDNLSDEALKESAAELLELARKELRNEIEFRREEYQTGYKDGKAEALKDFPMWKTVEKGESLGINKPYVGTNVIGEKTLYIGQKCISIHSLEKLPGFKERK